MILTERLHALMQKLRELRDRSDKIMSYYPGGKQLSDSFLKLSKVAGFRHIKSGEKPAVTDYSLRALLLRNFRKYGVPSGEYGYYGMYVSTDETPCSQMFLLGRNGVGKSSLFDAAEYFFTGNIGEAEYRRINARKFIHAETTGQDILALTGSGLYSKDKLPNAGDYLPVGKFFVSENSIIESLGSLRDDNFYPFICEMLGLGDIYELSKGNVLDEMMSVISKSPQIYDVASSKQNLDDLLYSRFFTLRQNDEKGLTKCFDSLAQLLEKWNNPEYSEVTLEKVLEDAEKISLIKYSYITPVNNWCDMLKVIRQRVKSLNAKHQRQTSKAYSIEKSTLDEETRRDLIMMLLGGAKVLIHRLEMVLSKRDERSVLSELKTKLDQYLHDEDEKNLLGLKGSDESAQFFNDLAKVRKELGYALSEYISTICNDNLVGSVKEVFDKTFIDSKNENFDIDVSHIMDGIVTMTVNGVSANRYFNTFRFRLLFIVLQISLCIRLMKFTKVSFPIFFDDVFYANDYNNKHELVKFFHVLNKLSEDITKDKIAFQYIFFSHDEQLVYALSEDSCLCNNQVKYCRILDTNTLNLSHSVHKKAQYKNTVILYKNVYVQIFT